MDWQRTNLKLVMGGEAPGLAAALVRRVGMRWRAPGHAAQAWPLNRVKIICIAMLLACVRANAAIGNDPRTATHWGQTIDRYNDKPDDWFRSDEGKNIAYNVVSWQNADGGWWKNYNPKVPRPNPLPPPALHDAAPGDTEDVWRQVSTFDNSATWTEMNIVARAYRVLGDEKFRDSFNRGLAYIFRSQYPNGGWPQRYPLQDNYGRYITFNDDAMLGVMNLLMDIVEQKPDVRFVDSPTRQKCQVAFDRGIACILKCQVRVKGQLTVWCQQYDPLTLEPRGGRTFELPGLTSRESADVIALLMRFDQPDSQTKNAIEAACAWYEKSRIVGRKWVDVHGPQYEGGRDRVLKDDPHSVIWARFYDITTNRPFFCDRSGKKLWSVEDVPHERRTGYEWFDISGLEVEQAYSTWKSRIAQEQ